MLIFSTRKGLQIKLRSFFDACFIISSIRESLLQFNVRFLFVGEGFHALLLVIPSFQQNQDPSVPSG